MTFVLFGVKIHSHLSVGIEITEYSTTCLTSEFQQLERCGKSRKYGKNPYAGISGSSFWALISVAHCLGI